MHVGDQSDYKFGARITELGMQSYGCTFNAEW